MSLAPPPSAPCSKWTTGDGDESDDDGGDVNVMSDTSMDSDITVTSDSLRASPSRQAIGAVTSSHAAARARDGDVVDDCAGANLEIDVISTLADEERVSNNSDSGNTLTYHSI